MMVCTRCFEMSNKTVEVSCSLILVVISLRLGILDRR
jgi:hypothetical protein